MNYPQAFTFLLRVRYGECDAQHVVFNARYEESLLPGGRGAQPSINVATVVRGR